MSTTVTPEPSRSTVVERAREFGADEADITRDATFEALDVDSLDLAELAQVVEDEFGVELKGDDVARSRRSATPST